MRLDEQQWEEKLLRIHSSLQPSAVVENVFNAAKALFCPDSGSLMLFDRKRHVLSIVSAHNLPDDVLSSRLRIGEGVAGKVAEQRKPRLIIGEVNRYPDFSNLTPRENLNTSLCLPLTSASAVLGVMNLNREKESPKPAYDETDLERASRLVLHATLALKNAKLAETLAKSYTLLNRADRSRAVLISRLFHQMKTPLSALRTYIDNFLAGTFGELEKTQKDKLGRMLEQLERLDTLIEDAQKSGRKELHLSRIRLSSLTNNALKTVQHLFDEKNMSVSVDVPDELEALVDPTKMEQALINLLTNAALYAEEGASVSIGIEQDEASIVIRVSNTGSAIPMDELERIFEENYRLDTHSHIKGSGLGLTIVKEIVEMHGGTIHAESSPKKEVTFFVQIPIL